MNKSTDRPPIALFLLAFGSLIAAALFLAAISPNADQQGKVASAVDGYGAMAADTGSGEADRSANGPAR